MRYQCNIFFLVLLFSIFSLKVYGGAQGVHLTPATANISSSFIVTPVMTLALPNVAHLYISNTSTGTMVLTSRNIAGTPSSSTTTNPQQIFIPPSAVPVELNGVGAGKYIYLRGDSATLTSGDIVINAY